MKLLKIPGKVLLTLIYPIAKVTILSGLDQLSGRPTGFLEGLKNIWRDNKKDGEK
jgi:hypothetical protein